MNSATLSGLGGDSGVAGKKLLTNGANGFTLASDGVFGSMTITGNTNAFTVAAATDATFNTNTDYVLFTGTGAPWAAEQLTGGMTFSVNRLIAPVSGIYRLDVWSNLSSFPSTSAKVAIKYRLNGDTFASRHPTVKSNSAGDYGIIHTFELVTMNSNDYIQLMVVSSAAGGVTISDMNMTLSLVKAS